MPKEQQVQRRKGWVKYGDGEWQADTSEPRTRALSSADLDAPERTADEMLAEVLRLANRQLAGLSAIAKTGILNDVELQQLGQVQRIVLGHVRINPGEDPTVQRDGETNEAYLERLETMKASAK